MAKNTYEGMFLLDPGQIAGDLHKAEEEVNGILERHEAEILVSRPWDERRLAYPIKKLKKGLYYITYFSAEPKNIVEIERDCHLNDIVVRQMVLKIDPKLADSLVESARGDGAAKIEVPDEVSEESKPEDKKEEPEPAASS